DQTQALLAPAEALATDRGFPLAQSQEAGLTRYVRRGATHCTAWRAWLPAYSSKGRRPRIGAAVRARSRSDKGRTPPATPQPAFCRALAAQDASAPQRGAGRSDVSGSLARGGAPPLGQADARGGAAMRVRPCQRPAATRIGAPRWEPPRLHGGHTAR